MTGFNADANMRLEMMRRMSDGWDLDGPRSPTRMSMKHAVLPPAWRITIDLINPIAWFVGPTWPLITRTLTVSLGPDGRLHRKTTGYIPHGWPRIHNWDVPDGPIER